MTIGKSQAAVGAAWWGCMVVGCRLPELCSSTPEHSVPPHLVCAPTVLSSGHLADGSGAWLGRAALTADIMSWRATMQVNSTNISNKGILQARCRVIMLRRTYDSGLSSDRAPGWAAVSSCASERAQQKEKELKAKSEAMPKRSQPHRLLPSPDTRCHSLTLAAVLALRFTKTQNRSAASHSRHHRHHRHPRPQNRHQGPPLL